ncbi:Transmembrane and coiled-coil domain-containing protein 4 [Bienertia sinuspersici]
MASSFLSPTQRYAAGTLFAIAIHQSQIHQSRPLGLPHDQHLNDDGDEDDHQRISNGSSSSTDSVSEDPHLWVHPKSSLLRPIFQFLEIDSVAWPGIEQTAGSSSYATHHVGAFLRLLSEESEEISPENKERESALAKGVDCMQASMEASTDAENKRDKQREYAQERREKCSVSEMPETPSTSSEREVIESIQERAVATVSDETHESEYDFNEEPVEEERILSYERKITVLYELLSGSLATMSEDNKKSKQRKGYDARHRVALRLLAAWLDVNEGGRIKKEEPDSEKSKWAKWKRGGIIGAAAVTGGALLAITGGLAAPAIAAGFGALAPTLGTIIPVIGAGGFAAAASVAGSVAGSVAIAASFGAAGAGLSGTKMARRIGNVDEFEFKAVGENHGQGRLAVGILVSGFVFDEKDFIMPWEGLTNNLERYVLVWESKHLIAVSTAIQDWLTSSLALGLMKQGAMMTVLSTLLTALAWPATLLALTDFIDSKWTIAVDR